MNESLRVMTDQAVSVSVEQIAAAAKRICGDVHRTPVMTCSTLDRMTGARLFFKCENLQVAGAFKARGAANVIRGLSDEQASRGVVTHSSGNHAAALALAAQKRGIPAYIVMPSNAPRVKVAAVRGYEGKIEFCEPTLAARETTAQSIQDKTGAEFVHPYNDPRIIAGQGTVALELIEQCPDLDVIIAPVGGGGLLAGTLLAAAGLCPQVRVAGAEPELVNDAWKSWKTGSLQPATGKPSIGDGLLTSLGELTFPVIQERIDRILLASEATIRRATRAFFERMKLVVEPSGAVPLAALWDAPEHYSDLRIGVIISGGNVDLDRFFSGAVEH